LLVKARIARNLTQKDLANALGIKEQQVQRYESELYRSANLKTLSNIAETLGLHISESAVLSQGSENSIEIEQKLPFTEMFNRGWFEDFSGSLNAAKKKTSQLINQFVLSSGFTTEQLALHRKKVRANGKYSDDALLAWQTRVTYLSRKQKLYQTYNHNRLTKDWFKELAKLSQYPEGPILAKDWLIENGIHFIVEKHLSHTHLDGAAIRHPSGAPIVALTLRHDRLDNFWFVLFHELAHIALHFPYKEDTDFFDEADALADEIEAEADQFALDSLIPREKWETCLSRFSLNPEIVREEAKQLQIHPSILAGRIRHEQNDYMLLNDIVGHSDVRKHFQNMGFQWE
jgi:HTH-type transcriptional regulator/antitoxin HigA